MNRNKKVRLALIFLFFFKSVNAYAGMNIKKIIWHESKGKPKAHNLSENARGLMQIRQCVLTEWNQYHPQDIHTSQDLFNQEINIKIGTWYIDKRCPQMLRHFNIPVTDKSIIICYNAGILRAIQHYRDGETLPSITVNYIEEYKR